MDSKNFHFIFPSHPLRPKLVEPTFSDQFVAFQVAGFSVSLAPDAVIDEGNHLVGIPPGSTVVYRGWMLNQSGYERLQAAVTAASAKLLIKLDNYLGTHHLPNWYDKLKDLTPETVVIPTGSDYRSAVAQLSWNRYFVKDYVKSITTSKGSIAHTTEDIEKAISDFVDYRGELEGGLCVRKVEPFIQDSECRYFVLMNRAYGPDSNDVPEIVREVTKRIQSPFYSVDVIRREDDEPRVVEIGDGQVSDLKAWTAQAFVGMWRSALKQSAV